jgi:hypothetical protein
MEFPTEEARKRYLHEHPKADPAKHTVKKNLLEQTGDFFGFGEDAKHDYEEAQREENTPHKPKPPSQKEHRIVDKVERFFGFGDDRVAHLRKMAGRMVEAIVIPREFHLPPQVRGADPVNPEGTDLYVWKYDVHGAPYAIAFVGKSSRPFWHYRFRSEAERESQIERTTDLRRNAMVEKLKAQQARRDFQHGFQVGDILYASWGYDQTNVDFYQVVEVRGKDIILREIGSRVVGNKGGPTEKVMAEPNEFIGPPLRKRPQGTGSHTYVKITQSQTAFEWDGVPLHRTGPNWGH